MDVVYIVANIRNVVGPSAKCRDIFREAHADQILKEHKSGELKTGRLNQEIVLKRAVDTC